MGTREKEFLTDSVYPKSNAIIQAKYKSTLFESKILELGLYKLQKDDFKSVKGGYVCEISASEIKNMIGDKISPKHVYDRLEKAASKVGGKMIGYKDDKKREFDYIALITHIAYKDGVLKMTFNSELREYILDIKSKFTMLSIQEIMSFDEVYTKKLYEFIKSKSYSHGKEEADIYVTDVSLAELKFLLGLIDSEEPAVKEVLNQSKAPDYEKAVQVAKNKKYDSWSNLRRKCLDPAVAEINAKTNMYVEYDTVKGRHGKVERLMFRSQYEDEDGSILMNKDEMEINPEDKTDESFKNTDIYKMSIVLEVSKMIEGVGTLDVISIAEAANYNLKIVEDKYTLLQEQTTEVENVTGWMIQAIREDYKKTAKVPKEKKTSRMGSASSKVIQNSDPIDFNEITRQMMKES